MRSQVRTLSEELALLLFAAVKPPGCEAFSAAEAASEALGRRGMSDIRDVAREQISFAWSP